MAQRIQRGALLQDLTQVNSWWRDPGWRDVAAHFQALARIPHKRHPPVLDGLVPPNLYTLRGPRRVGKSTLLKQTIGRLADEGVDPRRLCYFPADALATFTDLINLFQAARLLFPDLGETPRYFFIDEVTSIPEWQQGLKWLRDNTLVAGDCVVATGSSARDIAGGAGHLAGRRGPDVGLDRLLLPMSFPEFARCAGFPLPVARRLPLDAFYGEEGRAACQGALVHLGSLVDAFETYLLIGGFPQAVSDFIRIGQVSDGFARDLWDVALTDLRQMGLRRPEEGIRLLDALANSISGPVVLRSLAETLGVTHTTVGEWLGALADSYLTLVLFQQTGGVPEIRKQRKAYPIDPFLAYLPARHSPGVRSPAISQVAEAALAVALFRAVEGDHVEGFGRLGRLFYHRMPSGSEVDFVTLPGPRAAESKYIDVPSQRETRAMVAAFGGGLLLTRSAIAIHPDVTILPAAVFAWLLDQKG